MTGNSPNLIQAVKVVRSGNQYSNLSIQTTTSSSILQNLHSKQPPSLAPLVTASVQSHVVPLPVSSPKPISPNSKIQINKAIAVKEKKPVVSPKDNPSGSAPVQQQETVLTNEPPGTIIKCITAQVIQSPQGPRIVLQGLQGSNFTSQQLQLIQQQVKQQLLKSKCNPIYFICQKYVKFLFLIEI